MSGTAIPSILSQIRRIDRCGLDSPSLQNDLETLACDLNLFLGETNDVHESSMALGFSYVQRKSGFRYLWKVVYSEIMFPRSGDKYGLPILLVKRLASVLTSKVYFRIRLDENTLICENLEYGDFRALVMREDVSIELKFESLVCCRRFLSGCRTAMRFRQNKVFSRSSSRAPQTTRVGTQSDLPTPTKSPNPRLYAHPAQRSPVPQTESLPSPPGDEDLLGLFDSNSDDEDDPDEDVTKPFAYHSPKRESTAKAFSDTTANLSSKPLKEVIRMAKALNVNTDGMLDRQELEEAVECAIAAGGSAKPQPSLGATPRPSESAKPNLVEQMRNIRLQKEEAEAERIKKQRLWQEQENERRAEKDRLKKVRNCVLPSKCPW